MLVHSHKILKQKTSLELWQWPKEKDLSLTEKEKTFEKSIKSATYKAQLLAHSRKHLQLSDTQIHLILITKYLVLLSMQEQHDML